MLNINKYTSSHHMMKLSWDGTTGEIFDYNACVQTYFSVVFFSVSNNSRTDWEQVDRWYQWQSNTLRSHSVDYEWKLFDKAGKG